MKRDFLKNRISVNLAVTDIFDTGRFAIDARDVGFETKVYRKRETRIAALTVTVKLGKQEPGNRRSRRDCVGGGSGEIDEGL